MPSVGKMEEQQVVSEPLKVAYMLHRFPHLTETFIMREMYWLRSHAVQLRIFSLVAPRPGPVHEQARELLPYTTYTPYFSWDIVRAHAHYLVRKPLAYVRALGRVVWQTYREPAVLLRALALFPKSVLLARMVEEQGIDHIHAHFCWLEGISAGVVRDLTGTTFTLHPHAFDLFSRDQRDVRVELENASGIVTISGFHRDYIAALSPRINAQEIEVVHCGLEAERFVPARHTLNGPVRILSVGSLVEKKGHDYLIGACALLAERGIDFICDIVGAGHLESALQSIIDRHGLGERVTLLGAQDQARVLELYQQSDLFCLACVHAQNGDRDGIPVALMEAMACELPVVSTPVAGIPELITDGRSGFLVPEADTRSLADALERLIRDGGLRREMGVRGRQDVLEGFQVQTSAARMAAIFRKVSAPDRRTGGPGVISHSHVTPNAR
ncbi:MAG: glycosyltransferase [Anaerolineae bacterium]